MGPIELASLHLAVDGVEISDLKEVAEPELKRMPVTAYYPSSRISGAIRDLAKELLQEAAL